MTYSIGHIILGTYLPWDNYELQRIAHAVFVLDPPAFMEAGDDPSDWAEGLLDGSIDWIDILRPEVDGVESLPGEWETAYHGSADFPIAWCGVELGTVDDTDNFPVSDITQMLPGSLEQIRDAGAKYDALPAELRAVLPPYGAYIVWSTS